MCWTTEGLVELEIKENTNRLIFDGFVGLEINRLRSSHICRGASSYSNKKLFPSVIHKCPKSLEEFGPKTGHLDSGLGPRF